MPGNELPPLTPEEPTPESKDFPVLPQPAEDKRPFYLGGQQSGEGGEFNPSIEINPPEQIDDDADHPFKITYDDGKFRISYGALTVFTWDSSGDPKLIEGVVQTSAAEYLDGDPFHSGSTYEFIPTDGTLYGVWIYAGTLSTTTIPNNFFDADDFENIEVFNDSPLSTWVPEFDSTKTDISDGDSFSSLAVFIGTAKKNADGTVEIKQWRRSDIVLSTPVVPDTFTVDATGIDSTGASSGDVLTADGSGGASWA